jgi:formylglycine-generating enzyme required for sulfatase activity
VLRGGSWRYDRTERFRGAYRNYLPDVRRYDYYGFRAARSL